MATLKLEATEKRSAVAVKLIAYCEARVKELHDSLERSSDHPATEKIRGRIAEIRELQRSFEDLPDFKPVSADPR